VSGRSALIAGDHDGEHLREAEHLELAATRSAYDGVAELYAKLFADGLAARPLDRAMVAAFAELVQAAGGAPVADAGCGHGYLTAHLATLGLDAYGLDVSPAMIEIARRRYPDRRFIEGSMTDLDVADGTLGGVVAWYSIIHSSPERVPAALEEFHRAIIPGGCLLLAFFAADDPGGLVEPFDHKVIRAYRWPPDRLVDLLADAGFREVGRLVREPIETERFRQASLIARR
jgi:SAM-dependent methyltransferase